MIKANLFVERLADNDQAAESIEEDWGWIALSCAPNTGDHIRVWRELDFHIFKVSKVMHRAIPLPPSELGQKEPLLWILANWETIDLTSYANG